MADYKIVDAGQLDTDLTAVADAIRKRAGTSGKLSFPEGMAETVRSIPSDGIQLPELSSPASPEDMVQGKELYDHNGHKVTGSIEPGWTWYYHYHGDVTAYAEDGGVCFAHTFTKDSFYRKGERILLCHSDLGDATAEDVAKGKTFTTAEGVKMEGTMEAESGGVQMRVEGDTLYITGDVTVENGTLIL